MSDQPDEVGTPKRPPFRPFAYVYDGRQVQQLVAIGVEPTPDFVYEVRRALDDHEGNPVGLAKWICERIEEFGNQDARPVFDMQGNGPSCSWCGALAMLCQHGPEA